MLNSKDLQITEKLLTSNNNKSNEPASILNESDNNLDHCKILDVTNSQSNGIDTLSPDSITDKQEHCVEARTDRDDNKPEDVDMLNHNMAETSGDNYMSKMGQNTTLVDVDCLNDQNQENINCQMSLQTITSNQNNSDSNNNNYATSNLNLSTEPKYILNNDLTGLKENKLSLELNNLQEIYHPSTTTVNLSESNQSVYFMMQTSSQIDLITAQPAAPTPTGNINNNNSNSLKLKTSPTTTPTSVKKLYTPKYLDGSQILGTVANNSCLMSVNSALSSSSSSVNTSPNGTNKVVRDERRRANHNEVERRRRDNINKWIVELSKVIPDCSNDQSKHGQSKGGILEKTVQYLSDIKQTNQELHEHILSLQTVKRENEILREQNEMYKKENQYLKAKFELNDPSMLIDTIEDLKNSIDSSICNQAATTSSISSSSSASTVETHAATTCNKPLSHQ